MKDETTFKIIAGKAAQTQRLGRLIGRSLTEGLVIRLTGDLGAGKTCFVQGLAVGLQVPEPYVVTSPTYTLINEFPGRLPLIHVDLYRIHGSEDAESIGFYDMISPNQVVAVEWADRLAEDEYPAETLSLHFKIRDDDSRRIDIIGGGLKLCNLIKKVGSLWKAHED